MKAKYTTDETHDLNDMESQCITALHKEMIDAIDAETILRMLMMPIAEKLTANGFRPMRGTTGSLYKFSVGNSNYLFCNAYVEFEVHKLPMSENNTHRGYVGSFVYSGKNSEHPEQVSILDVFRNLDEFNKVFDETILPFIKTETKLYEQEQIKND